MTSRIEKLQARLVETQTDMSVVGPGPYMDWLVGFHPHPDERPCMLMVSEKSAGFLTPNLNADAMRLQSDLPFWRWSDDQGAAGALSEAYANLGVKSGAKIAVDETMRTDFSLLVMRTIESSQTVLASEVLGLLRMKKDASEIVELRKNAHVADDVIRSARAFAKAGISELEIRRNVESNFTKHGAKLAFATIANQKNAAYPHHSTSNDIIKDGEAFLMDIGGRTGLYPSDITRMQALGKVSQRYQDIHGIVEEAVQAALLAAKIGALASDVDDAARGVIAKAGYGDKFVHRTGHGIGVEVHEAPYITGTSNVVLEEGMCFSIEPGIYIEHDLGVRLEEIVAITKEGASVMSTLSREVEIL